MAWFKQHSYTIVRMLIYQFGIAILGIILTVATGTRSNLMLMVSLYAVLFYVILLYMMTWEEGAREGIRCESARVRCDRLCGLKLALCANIPNFLIALLLGIGYLFGVALGAQAWAQSMFVVVHGIAAVWEAMYLGVVNAIIPVGNALSPFYILVYALMPLPAILFSTFGYCMGTHNKRIFGKLSRGKK